jgi:hypothetical protein
VVSRGPSRSERDGAAIEPDWDDNHVHWVKALIDPSSRDHFNAPGDEHVEIYYLVR